MPDLLLELFSEEIPARMQAQAAKDLERLVVGALSDRGLLFEAAKSFAGPRRLTLAIAGLPAKQPDVSEELKGPKVDAPQAALDGFLRKTGLTKEQLKTEKTPKGDVYIGVIARKGRATAEVLSEFLPDTISRVPWPKSMRWPQATEVYPPDEYPEIRVGDRVLRGYSVEFRVHRRWVRPLHGIVCTLDGEVVPFSFAGVQSGNVTWGHRFLSHGPIEVRRFEDYEEKLRRAHVILDAAERKEIILHDARNKAFAQRLALVEDAGLLDEVVGLAEWPVVLIGSIEDEFMELPPEILQTSMRTHQKYFALRVPPPQSGGGGPPKAVEGAQLAPKFVVVANMVAEDGGKQIVAGNERVLRARLSDAKFFWDQDRKRTLESRVDDLKNIVFHAKLGTQYERVERIEALAGEIAEKIGADVTKAKRAARLCKADLTTGVVGEFPELQGVMGRYYALHDGEDAEVADAIRDHYKPLGPNDAVPTNKISIAVALADKLDQLAGFFTIGEKPTGSGDPYALRRAGLGAIRIVTANNVAGDFISFASRPALEFATRSRRELSASVAARVKDALSGLVGEALIATVVSSALSDVTGGQKKEFQEQFLKGIRCWIDLRDFLLERLEIALRGGGVPVGVLRAARTTWVRNEVDNTSYYRAVIDADVLLLINKAEALQAFLKTDDGANLLVAYRRAANILRDEEKRDKTSYDGEPDPELLSAPEEKALFVELATASELIRAEVEHERFVEAMGVMARLRKPVDAFFDKVTVNDKNPDLRKNRLLLLSRLRATLHLVADFSKIEG